MTVKAKKAPIHLWLVGGITLLWNCFGAYDYTMTHIGNLAYFAPMEEQLGVSAQTMIAFFQGFPAWVDAFWAFGVWGALAGSILLLLRSWFAVIAFALSLAGLAGSTVYQLTIEIPEWAQGGPNTVMNILIWSVATFLLIYSVSMRGKGTLR